MAGSVGVALFGCVRVGVRGGDVEAGQSDSALSSIHAASDRASPTEAGVAAPAIPGLAALAVVAPAGASLVDSVAGEVAHHPIDRLR